MTGPEIDPFERVRRYSIYSRRWHLQVNVLAASFLLPEAARLALMRRADFDLETCRINAGCFFFSSDVRIGQSTWISERCYFDSHAPIEIGARVAVGMEAMFCTSSHAPGSADKRAGPYVGHPINIGDGSWIGARAMVLPGCTVGEGCVIAAGAVVSEDCDPHGLFAGVPARRMRDLEPGEP